MNQARVFTFKFYELHFVKPHSNSSGVFGESKLKPSVEKSPFEMSLRIFMMEGGRRSKIAKLTGVCKHMIPIFRF